MLGAGHGIKRNIASKSGMLEVRFRRLGSRSGRIGGLWSISIQPSAMLSGLEQGFTVTVRVCESPANQRQWRPAHPNPNGRQSSRFQLAQPRAVRRPVQTCAGAAWRNRHRHRPKPESFERNPRAQRHGSRRVARHSGRWSRSLSANVQSDLNTTAFRR